jgi:uncharacterized membrane protein
MRMAGFLLESRWLLWSIALYALAVTCWLPVVWLQIRMRTVARIAADGDMPLPMSYWRYFSIWFALGIPAFAAFVIVFYLMVVKPV